jgi:hypothetical protein
MKATNYIGDTWLGMGHPESLASLVPYAGIIHKESEMSF